jgi:hypothetical protein
MSNPNPDRLEFRRSMDAMQLEFVGRIDDHAMSQGILEAIRESVVRRVAERIVEEQFASIAALIDPQAIANLAVAQAGAALNRTLQERLPGRDTPLVDARTFNTKRSIF